jgi:hypothetical protein
LGASSDADEEKGLSKWQAELTSQAADRASECTKAWAMGVDIRKREKSSAFIV